MDRKLLNIELGRISAEEYKHKAKSGIAVVLDNIRSAHNVGSIFRTADSFGIDYVALCGISAVPPTAEIHKSALGAEDSVPWEHFDDTLDAIRKLKENGFTIIAVEQTEHATELQNLSTIKGDKLAFVFGNEVDGVRQDVINDSNCSIVIPQFGTKHSLNVSVCAGAVLWEAVRAKA